jgi:hypothetical protein
MKRFIRADLVFLIAAVILSLHTVPYELRLCTPPPPHGDDSPEALVAGEASTPYQYRVLVPWLVRGALATGLITPESQLTMFAAIQVAVLIALAFVFRRFLELFVKDRVLTSVMALSLYAILPFNYFNFPYYPYDVPAVLFFTLGLILIHDEKWSLFFPLFIVATINRESSIFLAVATALVFFDKYAWPKLAMLVGSQAAIWTVIKTALWLIYRQNRWLGYGLYQFQLRMNIATLRTFPVKGAIALATWGCLWIAVVVWHQRIRDPFLRRTLLTIPVFVAAMFIVGFVIELRIYGEVLPIVLAAFWVVFLDLCKRTESRNRVIG